MVTIRSATSSDHTAISRIAHSVGSDAIAGNVTSTPHEQRDGYVLQRTVAVDAAGAVLGYSQIAREPWRAEGWFALQIVVDPSYRQQGVGTALLHEVVQHFNHPATLLESLIQDNDNTAVRWAQHRYFHVVQHFFTMKLDVAGVDEARLLSLVAAAEAADFQFFAFADVAHDPDARRKLYELNRRLAPDLPGNDDSFPSFDEYTHEIIEAAWFRPEGQFIAAYHGQWIGLVGMGFDDEQRQMSHEFTAVDRAYRGRSVAQALKSRSILLARQLGIREIVTGNDASNAAIVAVNGKLGYRQQPGLYKLQRRLG